MSLGKYSLDELLKKGVYVGLEGAEGEVTSGGYQRRLVKGKSHLKWSNTGDTPWAVDRIAVYDSPTSGNKITDYDAGRGVDPAMVLKNDVFEVNVDLE